MVFTHKILSVNTLKIKISGKKYRGKREKMDFEETQREIAELFKWHENRRIEALRVLHKSHIETDKPYYFLTVNPRPDIKLEVFLKTIRKAISKKWITYYLMVIEQRGETEEDIHGFHTHIIFNKGTKHCKVVSEMRNAFQHMCDCKKFELFNLVSIGEDEKARKIEYTIGDKADPVKRRKQLIDIIFRKKNKLKSYYTIEQPQDAV